MALLDLATLKAFLNESGTGYDAELQLYVDAVPDVVEALIGGPVEQRTITETVQVSDGGRALMLGKRFAVSVTSITANGVAVSTTDVRVADGNVLRRALGYRFWPCYGPVVAVYVAGVAVPGSAPKAATLAAAVIAGHMWATQRGNLGGSGPGDEFGTINTVVPGLGYAVPNRALELLGPWLPETGLVLA